MSDSVVETVENVVQLNKLREEVRMKLIADALAGKLDITNPTLIAILRDVYKSGIENMNVPPTLEGHKGKILCLTEYKGKLVSGGKDGTIRIWDLSAPLK